MEPDLLDSQLDLLERVVLHSLGDKLGIDLNMLIRGSARCDLIEEFAEINANRQINKYALVQTSIVISVNGLDIF